MVSSSFFVYGFHVCIIKHGFGCSVYLQTLSSFQSICNEFGIVGNEWHDACGSIARLHRFWVCRCCNKVCMVHFRTSKKFVIVVAQSHRAYERGSLRHWGCSTYWALIGRYRSSGLGHWIFGGCARSCICAGNYGRKNLRARKLGWGTVRNRSLLRRQASLLLRALLTISWFLANHLHTEFWLITAEERMVEGPCIGSSCRLAETPKLSKRWDNNFSWESIQNFTWIRFIETYQFRGLPSVKFSSEWWIFCTTPRISRRQKFREYFFAKKIGSYDHERSTMRKPRYDIWWGSIG